MTWMDKRFGLEPSKDRISELVGGSIDKLINMDMSALGIIGALYEAARKKFGRSLTLLAAEKLMRARRSTLRAQKRIQGSHKILSELY